MTLDIKCHTMLSFETDEQLGNDGKEGVTYAGIVSKRYRKDVMGIVVSLSRGEPIAVKTFKSTKSGARIRREASFQQRCAKVDVSPTVYAVDTTKKYIAMEQLESQPVKTYAGTSLPDTLQYQLCALMHRMDTIGVLHNDMNAHNIMLNRSGRPYVIDFGLSKEIRAKERKKFGDNPNISVTLWGLVRGFKRYKVKCDVLEACVKAKKKESFFEKGESLLNRKRKR